MLGKNNWGGGRGSTRNAPCLKAKFIELTKNGENTAAENLLVS